MRTIPRRGRVQVPGFGEQLFKLPIELTGTGSAKTACIPLGGTGDMGTGGATTLAVADAGRGHPGEGLTAQTQDVTRDTTELVGLTRGDGLVFGTFDRRPRVSHLQDRLVSHGAPVRADGMIGDGTAGALHQFQSRSGLAEAETVDAATAEALASPPGQPSVVSEIEGLRRGDGLVFGTFERRPRVRTLQTRLNAHGFETRVDGMFGDRTAESLRNFQISQGISATEIVDRSTADELEDRGRDSCPAAEVPRESGSEADAVESGAFA